MLFGDELQTKVNHIRVSNKINKVACTPILANKRPYVFFLGKNGCGQRVVQEIDQISEPLKETSRPNRQPKITSGIISRNSGKGIQSYLAITFRIFSWENTKLQNRQFSWLLSHMARIHSEIFGDGYRSKY